MHAISCLCFIWVSIAVIWNQQLLEFNRSLDSTSYKLQENVCDFERALVIGMQKKLIYQEIQELLQSKVCTVHSLDVHKMLPKYPVNSIYSWLSTDHDTTHVVEHAYSISYLKTIDNSSLIPNCPITLLIFVHFLGETSVLVIIFMLTFQECHTVSLADMINKHLDVWKPTWNVSS